MVLVWILLRSNVYVNVGTQDERERNGLLVLRHRLLAWYKKRKRENTNESITEVHDITPKMVGTYNDPKLKLKGAETLHLFCSFWMSCIALKRNWMEMLQNCSRQAVAWKRLTSLLKKQIADQQMARSNFFGIHCKSFCQLLKRLAQLKFRRGTCSCICFG